MWPCSVIIHGYKENLRDETNIRIVAIRLIPNMVTIRRFTVLGSSEVASYMGSFSYIDLEL